MANTNVRRDSDADVCVRCSNTYFDNELPPEVSNSVRSPGFPATLLFPDYKSRIERALVDKFGRKAVTPGDKAFRISENSYRIQADVVPTFEYHYWFFDGSKWAMKLGTCFFTDSGRFIINFPNETLSNGRLKNVRTGHRYKRVVRVIKGLRNEMESRGFESAKKISSFQIACLAYNVGDQYFAEDLYQSVFDVALMIRHGAHKQTCMTWTEIDEIKLLFAEKPMEKMIEVKNFFSNLMSYVDFKEV